jgi:hypothetical protein
VVFPPFAIHWRSAAGDHSGTVPTVRLGLQKRPLALNLATVRSERLRTAGKSRSRKRRGSTRAAGAEVSGVSIGLGAPLGRLVMVHLPAGGRLAGLLGGLAAEQFLVGTQRETEQAAQEPGLHEDTGQARSHDRRGRDEVEIVSLHVFHSRAIE